MNWAPIWFSVRPCWPAHLFQQQNTKERDIRKDVPFLWPPAAGNGCLPGNFKYPRADAVCASIRVISGRRR